MDDQTERYIELVSKLIDCEPPGYIERVFELIRYVSNSDCLGLVTFFKNRCPVEVAFSEPLRQAEIPMESNWYTKGVYIVDPFYQASLENSGDRFATIIELAPSGFRGTGYFTKYYKQIGFLDEAGYLVHVDSTACLHLNVITRRTQFDKKTIENLRAQLPIVATCLKEFWRQVLVPAQMGMAYDDAHKLIVRAFDRFGASILTRRECDVVKLCLKGYSAKEAADVLNISTQTLVVHRRNIYQKLSIKSQAELFALFLDSLLLPQENQLQRPLLVYQS